MEEKKEMNFCVLCGKYVEGDLKTIQIAMLADNYGVSVKGCHQCEIVLSNAMGIVRRALQQYQEKIKQMKDDQQRRIIVPGMGVPRDLIKNIKGKP